MEKIIERYRVYNCYTGRQSLILSSIEDCNKFLNKEKLIDEDYSYFVIIDINNRTIVKL
jgi:hypothetical protein